MPPYVASVSHLQGFRNIVELIEGFVLANEGAMPRRQLLIAGVEQLPGYLARIRAAIDRLRAHDDVKLLGAIPQAGIRPFVEGCEVFAFSSTCENCPTSLIEAMSCGVAIACSNVGVMPEIARDAVLYFDPYSPADIARVLRRLFDEPELRRELGERSRIEARRFPTPAEVARETMKVLLEAAASR